MDPATSPIPRNGPTNEEPEEVWEGLVRTISRVAGRSRRGSDEKRAQAGNGDDVAAPQQVVSEGRKDGEIPVEEIDAQDTFPEGGLRAWLVVVAAWFLLFCSFGLMVSIGTLQDYWSQHQLADLSASTVAWIPSVFVYLSLALGLFVGPLFDRYGPRWIALCGSVAELLMIFLLAECKTFWQMMLCCGVLGGLAGALLTTTSLAAVAHWFKEKRGLAQGIAMAGSSCGGLVIPLILRTTLPKYGYAWSMRILGFVFLFCFVVGNILIKARLPPSAEAKRRSMVSLSIYADLRLGLFTVAVFGFEVVLFGALGILPTYATLTTSFSPTPASTSSPSSTACLA